MKLESLRQHIAVVTQDAHFFHDTIRANLLYANPSATDQELIESLGAAQILPLIECLPNGLDALVGDRGYRFSGGEKQRLAIARLLRADQILVVQAGRIIERYTRRAPGTERSLLRATSAPIRKLTPLSGVIQDRITL